MAGPFLHPFARPTAVDFTTIVRGEGAAVFDREGNRYVDALAGLWFCQIGHGRREMAEAIAEQAATLASYHCFERFTNEPAEAFAAAVVALAPMPDARVLLTSSGSEAVDSAMKLARLAMVRRGEPARTMIVSRRHGYHGVTYGGTSAQGIEANRAGFGPLLDGVVQTSHDDLEEVAALFDRHGASIAACIAEPVIAAGGVRPAPPGYLEGLRRLCDEHGALLILDEVVSGFGRLGTWWAADALGIEPDLVTFAKGATSGYLPLGGVLVGRSVRAPLEADPAFVLRHGHTYSGHATACAAGLENLRILRDEDLLARAEPIGDRIGGGLHDLAEQGLLPEVRGRGGMWAADLPVGVDATAVRDEMMRHGVLPRALGPSTIAFCPPLVIGDDDLDRCVDALGAAVRALQRTP